MRELYGVMAARGAAGGFVVSAGSYTADARAFARGRNIELIDGAAFFDMVRSVREKIDAVPQAPVVPTCPSCGKAMVRRTAKRGPEAGRDFWGCSGFPGCRGTRAIN